MPSLTEPKILPLHVIAEWSPKVTPHCSDCRYAKVHGDPAWPTAYCAMGEGSSIELWRLIRRHRPTGFRNAAKCSHFESMGDPA